MIDKHEYFLRIAETVALRANCTGRHVGAVVAKDERILATGYNGTAEGMPNCLDGGCARCARGRVEGVGYDVCSCVHAEGNLLASAARFGVSLAGATVYSTLQPCFSCAKELIQAGIVKVYYLEPWFPKQEWQVEDYVRLQERLGSERVHLNPIDVEAELAASSDLVPATAEADADG